MKGHLLMSLKERQRLVIMERVAKREMTCDQASRALHISPRQVQRLLGRYREEGHAGLLHRARGRPSPRKKPAELRDRALSLFREKYSDFGPTLASETLAERDGVIVNAETLRLWLIEEGLWLQRRQRHKHRTWRKRKECFGEFIQMDGSIHKWFEDRGPACFLMSMVDDATGLTLLRFEKEETTRAAMGITRQWVETYGIPARIYSDRKKVYCTDRQPTISEQIRGEEPQSQFGRACTQLGIKLSLAHSPQAKGRVERKHGVCQDRLIKALRLNGISSIDGANTFLKEWLPAFNRKFVVEAKDPTDLHRPVSTETCLDSIFCRHEERCIQKDWTVRYLNRWFQIVSDKDHPLPKSGNRVVVEAREDGTLCFRYKDQSLAVRELVERPKNNPSIQARATPETRVPDANHPWRKQHYMVPEPWYRDEQVNEIAMTYLPATPWPDIDRQIGIRALPESLSKHDTSILERTRHF